MAQFNENVELLNASGITVQLKNVQGEIVAGGNGTQGSVKLTNGSGNNQITMSAQTGDIIAGGSGADGDLYLFKASGTNATLTDATVHIDGQGAELTLGGNNTEGDIFLKSLDNKDRVRLLGDANCWIGGNGVGGDVMLFRSNGDNATLANATVHLNGDAGDIRLGCNGTQGDLVLKGDNNKDRARLLGDGNLWLGGNGTGGDVVLFKSTGDNATLANATVSIDGDAGDVRLGCNGTQGDLVLKGDNNKDRVRLLGDANMWIGGNGADGDIVLFKSDGDNTTLERATIHLDGQSGNIRCNDVNIPGADFAEDFDIDLDTLTTLEPGTVMVLGRDGKLLESTEAFDRKVAGVVSGAGKYKAGIILDKQLDTPNRMPIALSGKVMCKIDASYGSISVGDLITTSPRKGYAMKASDPFQAFGAVIGKALADFPAGDGMLPILVALQ